MKDCGTNLESTKVGCSPANCTGIIKALIEGRPDPKHICTTVVERQHLTMLMSKRRFTQLANEFSKKLECHSYAISLYFVFYNWMRIHKTLKVTPAMQAGLTDKLMSMEDLCALMDAVAPKPGRPKPHQNRTSVDNRG